MKHGEITQLAKQVGITTAHMSFILKRSRRPSPDVARKLSEATGVPLESWLFPDDFKNPYIPAQTDGESKSQSMS